jgi:hypothetical protein
MTRAEWNSRMRSNPEYREQERAKQRLYARLAYWRKHHHLGKSFCFGGCGRLTANKILRMVDENGKWVEKLVFYCGKC